MRVSVRDHRDVVIETLADSEARLRARVQSLEHDIEIYKTIVLETVARCSELSRENQMISSRAYVHRTRTAPRNQEVAA